MCAEVSRPSSGDDPNYKHFSPSSSNLFQSITYTRPSLTPPCDKRHCPLPRPGRNLGSNREFGGVLMKKVLILGAAGRDFHNFNVVFRDNPDYQVVAFTATQIPDIAGRLYPRELAGRLYPQGIPIFEEKDLEQIVADEHVDTVVFSYSDISYPTLMHLASRVVAAGADFWLLGAEHTQLKSNVPVISVCAVRTGCGKSPVSRLVAAKLREQGHKPVVIRHPMPYGDLAEQAVQRFATLNDLDLHQCTIEECEEYEPHISHGTIVYAGVDYERILRQAEKEADVILWDGGNNDTSFLYLRP